jgi:hypothetical protein
MVPWNTLRRLSMSVFDDSPAICISSPSYGRNAILGLASGKVDEIGSYL